MVTTAEALEHLYPDANPYTDYRVGDSGSGPEITYWNPALGTQPSPATLAAVTEAQVTAARLAKVKAAAKALYDDLQAAYRLQRAVVKLTVDELNALRQWVTSFKAAVAASSSFGNYQTRVAALANLADRTYAQAKTAVQNLINGE